MSLLSLADCWPRRFTPSSLALQFCEDPTQAEQPLFAKASAGEAVAQLWQAPQGICGARELSSVCGSAGSQRILPRAAGRYGSAAPGAVCAPQGRALSTLASPGRCSSRSARPPNPSITRCARCCSVPSRASALPATPGR